MSAGSGFGWTVVVLTCQHKDSVYSFQRGECPADPAHLSRGHLND